MAKSLANYDRVVAESRARMKAANERRRTWDLEQLERERLSSAEREKRMSELRMKWWHEDLNADLDARIRREVLERQLDEIDETAARSRRAEEARTVKHTERMMEICRGSGRTPVHVARMFHRIRTERPGDPEIPDLCVQVDQWARELDVEIRWTATPVNGYARRGTNKIEIAPIRSEAAFATAAHEIGHVMRVTCELAASVNQTMSACRARHGWGSQAMHADMADALPSYRDYGSAEQQAEIDRLTSRLGFNEIRLQRAMRDTKKE